MAKPQRYCIFCEGSNLSREHIWPQWMHDRLISKDGTEKTQTITRFSNLPDGTLNPIARKHVRQGDAMTQTVKVVCKTCNETWMSTIETEAKDSLINLIRGSTYLLSPDKQIVISKWIALKAIICEFTDIPTKAISKDQIRYFYENKLPPDDWSIWITHYRGINWRTRYRHSGFQMANRKSIVHRGQPCNVQTSTLVAGECFMHAFSTTHEGLAPDARAYLSTFPALPIWPVSPTTFVWPNIPVMNDDAAAMFADELTNALRDITNLGAKVWKDL